jgi:hypothetical protein
MIEIGARVRDGRNEAGGDGSVSEHRTDFDFNMWRAPSFG